MLLTNLRGDMAWDVANSKGTEKRNGKKTQHEFINLTQTLRDTVTRMDIAL